MGDGILDLIAAQAKEKPVDNMSAIYEDEPNTGLLKGLLGSLFGYDDDYSQPSFFGQDSVSKFGASNDYPRFRTNQDEIRYQEMMPKREWFNTEEEYIQAHNQAEYDYGNRERMPYQVFHGGYVNPEN